jgi:hypothetical protein
MLKKRGWLRIVEAFVMILLITGVLLIVLDKGSLLKNNDSKKIYEDEQGILRKIQLNNSLRDVVLSFPLSELPIEWVDFSLDIKNKIISKTPSYLNCEAKICNVNGICVLSQANEKSVYVQSTIFTSTLDKNDPRQLKLFCWKK